MLEGDENRGRVPEYLRTRKGMKRKKRGCQCVGVNTSGKLGMLAKRRRLAFGEARFDGGGVRRWRYRETMAKVMVKVMAMAMAKASTNTESEDQKDGCGSAGSQGRRTVGRLKTHREKEEGIRLQLPSF